MPATTQHRQLPPLSAPQAQETRDVQRYLSALFGRETPGALIDVRWRYRGGMSQRFLPAPRHLRGRPGDPAPRP